MINAACGIFQKSIELSIFGPNFVILIKQLLALQGVSSRGANRIRRDEFTISDCSNLSQMFISNDNAYNYSLQQ